MQTPAATDDAALVRRVASRDPEAIRTIMQRYNRRLYRIARSILKDDTEAEDAVQSAYAHACAALHGFRGDSGLGTWLTRIVMNEALGRLRSRRPAISWESDGAQATVEGQVVPFPYSDVSIDPERSMAQRQIRTIVERAIDDLPAHFRTVLVARLMEDMSVEETAELLGLRPETVKTRLHRARQLLRAALERQIGPALVDAFPFDGRRCERLTERLLARFASPAIGREPPP